MPTKGVGWITARQAGRLLHVSPSWVKNRAREGRLHYEAVGNYWFFRREDIEAIAQTPEHQRRLGLREQAAARRYEERPRQPARKVREIALAQGLIPAEEACAILNMTRQLLSYHVRAGHLPCFQNYPGQAGSSLWFRWEDVEELRIRREAGEFHRSPKPKTPELPKEPRKVTGRRPPLRNRFARVGVGDISIPDRYFGEWLTTRQVAWLLNVTLGTVYAHYRRGHFRGVREGRPGRGGLNWRFLKREVLALLESASYFQRRALWESLFSEEGRARREAENFARGIEMMARVNLQNRVSALELCEKVSW